MCRLPPAPKPEARGWDHTPLNNMLGTGLNVVNFLPANRMLGPARNLGQKYQQRLLRCEPLFSVQLHWACCGCHALRAAALVITTVITPVVLNEFNMLAITFFAYIVSATVVLGGLTLRAATTDIAAVVLIGLTILATPLLICTVIATVALGGLTLRAATRLVCTVMATMVLNVLTMLAATRFICTVIATVTPGVFTLRAATPVVCTVIATIGAGRDDPSSCHSAGLQGHRNNGAGRARHAGCHSSSTLSSARSSQSWCWLSELTMLAVNICTVIASMVLNGLTMLATTYVICTVIATVALGGGSPFELSLVSSARSPQEWL